MAFAQTTPDGDVQVGRYSTVPAEPLPEQIHLLDAMVTLNFPKSHVKTVGDAIDHLLRQSGYQIADAYASDPAVEILMSRPLPEVQRQLGPCPLRDALSTLAGPAYQLVVDPLHRLVSFEVANQYRALAQPPLPIQPAAYSGNGTDHQDSRIGRLSSGSAIYRYGPVKRDDTLLPIALKMRPDQSVAPEQMMLALLNTNPQAFGKIGGEPNLHFLRSGVILKAPTRNAWRQWSSSEARREVMRQYRRWQRYADRG
jgi:type IV pili sensor histidine kinase/response regulator